MIICIDIRNGNETYTIIFSRLECQQFTYMISVKIVCMNFMAINNNLVNNTFNYSSYHFGIFTSFNIFLQSPAIQEDKYS